MSDHLHPSDLPAPPAPTQLVPPSPKALRMDLALAGDPAALRNGLAQMLIGLGWKVEWDAVGWSGRATKGSKAMNFLFGAFAQYHEMTFSFSTRPDGSTALTVCRAGDGCMGGLYGMYRVKKSFKEFSSMVEGHYASAGALIGSDGH